MTDQLRRGEVWLANLNPTQGSEQAGIRPVIIFQNDLVSQFSTTTIAIPLTFADSRKDFLHKLTTQLVRENQVIAVEDLAVRNLVKNRSLARSITDAAWGELVRQIEYKCQWYGRDLVKVDRFFPSSKRCGNCGFVIDKLPLSIREWECPECRAIQDRDINSANNILAAGLAVTAPVTHGGNPHE